MAEAHASPLDAQQRSTQLQDLTHDRLDADAARFATYGESLQGAGHNYHELSLFTDDSLLELLSTHPRRRIQCFTMGDDPTHPEEWQAVCIRENDAERLLHAVKHGHIWLNITSPERYDPRYEAVIRDMYERVERMCPTIVQPGMHYNTLVLAAPGTQFYYTVHPESNMLWCMRGTQTVSALPAMDFRFVPQDLLEEIFANEASGAIAYSHDMEAHAATRTVTAGECIWWPQSAPTRMVYEDFCVSLFTSFYCPMRARREHVQLANRYLLRPLGIDKRRTEESGLRSELKQLLFRVMKRVRPPKKAYDFTDSYIANLRVDTQSPDCLRALPQTVAPEFSRFTEVPEGATGAPQPRITRPGRAAVS